MKELDLIIGAIKARILKWSALTGITVNMDKINDTIWTGGINNPNKIISEGFQAVLDLREKVDPNYKKTLEDNDIDYENIKIPDGEGTTVEKLESIAQWINGKNDSNQKTLIHCNLGRGRAALAIVSYLIHKGTPLDEAIRLVKKRRSVTYLNEKQIQSLKALSDHVRKKD